MKTLYNQTIYQCEYCGKRLLSRNGAKIHENEYCWSPDSPAQKAIIEAQEKCDHPYDKRETVYHTMPGESHLLEPNYDICSLCNKRM